MTLFSDEPYPELPEISTRAANLIGRCVSGVGSPDDWQQLSDMLESDDDVLHYYVAYSELHAALISCSPLGAEVSQLASVENDLPTQRKDGSLGRPLGLVLAVLACSVVIGALLLLPQAESDSAIARCVFSTATDLRINGEPNYDRRMLSGTSIQFSEGSVGISLDAGVDLVIDGPADLQLIDRNHLILHSGKLVADARDDSEAISIETSRCVVNDKGGRFGLASYVGHSDSIAVFQGSMQVSQRNRSHQLQKGDAIRVDSAGEVSRLPAVVSGLFPDAQDINQTARDRCVIASVTDNVVGDSVYAFYHVAPNGFGEDAEAYADRLHQWNSIGPGGIPEFLQDAEYVKTLNDDLYHDADLQIDLNLQRPANVYVLYPECLVVPEWLSRDFVCTELRIGLDEGPVGRQGKSLKTELDTGPGQSVDSNFLIWSRIVETPGTIHLGKVDRREKDLPPPQYGGHNGANMYGIVVTPLGQ